MPSTATSGVPALISLLMRGLRVGERGAGLRAERLAVGLGGGEGRGRGLSQKRTHATHPDPLVADERLSKPGCRSPEGPLVEPQGGAALPGCRCAQRPRLDLLTGMGVDCCHLLPVDHWEGGRSAGTPSCEPWWRGRPLGRTLPWHLWALDGGLGHTRNAPVGDSCQCTASPLAPSAQPGDPGTPSSSPPSPLPWEPGGGPAECSPAPIPGGLCCLTALPLPSSHGGPAGAGWCSKASGAMSLGAQMGGLGTWRAVGLPRFKPSPHTRPTLAVSGAPPVPMLQTLHYSIPADMTDLPFRSPPPKALYPTHSTQTPSGPPRWGLVSLLSGDASLPVGPTPCFPTTGSQTDTSKQGQRRGSPSGGLTSSGQGPGEWKGPGGSLPAPALTASSLWKNSSTHVPGVRAPSSLPSSWCCGSRHSANTGLSQPAACTQPVV